MFSIAVSVMESIEAVNVKAGDDFADIDEKWGEWGEVHGLKHSSAFIDDLLSRLVDINALSTLSAPDNIDSFGEVVRWKWCGWPAEMEGDIEDDEGIIGGEAQLWGVNAEGGRGVGSGERWEWGGDTRLGSIWGGGGPRAPSCIDKKYFVAAWRSCSLSSAVWRLKKKLAEQLGWRFILIYKFINIFVI